MDQAGNWYYRPLRPAYFTLMKRPIHFAVIDDHSLVREGIQALLLAGISDSQVKLYGRIPAVDEILSAPIPDMIICDYRVDESNALEFLIALATHSATPPVLIISMLDELEVGLPCIRAGARGFVSKSASSQEIIIASQMLLAGKTYMSSDLTRALMSAARKEETAGPESPTRRLTPRELQIFSALGEGFAVSSIAERCGISVKTVEAHRENIKNKLNLHSATEVVIAAAQWLRSGS
jgi:two-component system, NarL family, nitrate/nitrite response regulator NarL